MEMPKKITRHSLQINNLKFLCSYLSRQHAIQLAEEKGVTVKTCENLIPIEKHRKIMKYAAAAGFEFDGFDKQHIDGYSVVRIYKQAPYFFQLINHIDKSFKVVMQPQPIDCSNNNFHLHLKTIYDYSANFPAIVKKAFYFMTSWEFWTVHPDSKTPTSREGYNLGLSNLKNYSVSFNIEFGFDLKVLIHEIVHLKHGDWNEKIVHEATAMIAQDFSHLLKSIDRLKPKLISEVKRIAREFERFDYKVGQILGPTSVMGRIVEKNSPDKAKK